MRLHRRNQVRFFATALDNNCIHCMCRVWPEVRVNWAAGQVGPSRYSAGAFARGVMPVPACAHRVVRGPFSFGGSKLLWQRLQRRTPSSSHWVVRVVRQRPRRAKSQSGPGLVALVGSRRRRRAPRRSDPPRLGKLLWRGTPRRVPRSGKQGVKVTFAPGRYVPGAEGATDPSSFGPVGLALPCLYDRLAEIIAESGLQALGSPPGA